MPQAINNSIELQRVIYEVEQRSLQYVAKKATELIRELIISMVYDAYTPIGDGEGRYIEKGGGEFGRLANDIGNFGGVWGERESNGESITIGYLSDNLQISPELYVHSSPTARINAEQLADLIFGGYTIFGHQPIIPPRDAWDEFLKQLQVQVPIWMKEVT